MNKQRTAGKGAFGWLGFADFSSQLVEGQICLTTALGHLGKEEQGGFHRIEGENVGVLYSMRQTPKSHRKRQGKSRHGQARREGWGLGRKRWRRRGALSRCYGPDLI